MTRPAIRGSNLARGNGNGPSFPASSASSPPASVRIEVVATTTRHSPPPKPLTRCGVAEPIVSAPTSTPSAIPRPARNHVAIDFIAGG